MQIILIFVSSSLTSFFPWDALSKDNKTPCWIWVLQLLNAIKLIAGFNEQLQKQGWRSLQPKSFTATPSVSLERYLHSSSEGLELFLPLPWSPLGHPLPTLFPGRCSQALLRAGLPKWQLRCQSLGADHTLCWPRLGCVAQPSPVSPATFLQPVLTHIPAQAFPFRDLLPPSLASPEQ